MSSSAVAYRKAASCLQAPALWITDDVLSNAWHRFLTSRTKRHGSNVPGPLEARKRLARRRMAGLSVVGAPGQDLGFMFLNGPPRQNELSWEPPWVVGRSGVDGYQKSPLPFPFDTELQSPRPSPKLPFEERVRQLKSLNSARELYKELVMEDMDHAVLSGLAFKALMRNGARFEDVTGFLGDVDLNVPEARNMSAFFGYYSIRALSSSHLHVFLEILHRALVLGLLSPPETLKLIKSIQPLVASTYPTDWEAVTLQAYRHIWEGSLECRVLPVDPAIQQELLAQALSLKNTPEVAYFTLGLYQSIWPLGRSEHGLASYLAHWLQLVHGFEKAQAKNGELSRFTLSRIIDMLPEESFVDDVVHATRLLGAQSTSRSMLNLWMHVLRRSDRFKRHTAKRNFGHKVRPRWISIYEALPYPMSLLELSNHFTALGPVNTCRVILEAWAPRIHTPAQLSHLHEDYCGNGSFTRLDNLRSQFERLVSNAKDTSGNAVVYFANLINAFAQCHIPHRRVMAVVFNFVLERLGGKAVLELVLHLRRFHVRMYPGPILRTINKVGKDDPQLAYALYKCRSVWLSRAPGLLPALIHHGMPRQLLFRLLHRRDPGARSPLAHRTRPSAPLTPLRIALVHMMADAFARRPHGTARQAYRAVYLCYCYLRGYEAAVGPGMTRALVHAGVTRALMEGGSLSTERFRWILGVVRRVEGWEAAEELDHVVFELRARVGGDRRYGAVEEEDGPPVWKIKRHVSRKGRDPFGVAED
ncbi:hypothetical protein EJ06DRAFT_582608 [Trichodelitschia bisporula]|uniref:Uncharacterized protein n=1 Tax=Trichodelitschia bisporula TaxID=703511 RepID=A0A6G1HWC4_9PEZI|nr:hypothetical protein EJ06DRAFT_582608 [Trichodelitschia bisporula]